MSMKANNKQIIITNTSRHRNMIQSFLLGLPEGGTLDVITRDFEASVFLQFTDGFQRFEKIRILIGNEEKPKFQKDVIDRIRLSNDRSIEIAKEHSDELEGLAQVRDAINSGQIKISAYLKDKLHGALYLYTDQNGEQIGYVGSSDFSMDGLQYGTEINAGMDKGQCEEMSALFEKLFAGAEDMGEEVVAHIDRHIRDFSPYEIYLKSLYEYFKGREISPGVWEKQDS